MRYLLFISGVLLGFYLFLTPLPTGAGAAISVDATSSLLYGGFTTCTTCTWTHVTGASAKLLIVGLFSDGTGDPTSVTYNSLAMTLIASSTFTGNKVWLYYLANPPTGSNSVSAVWSASQPDVMGGSITYNGASTTGIPDSTNNATQVGGTTQAISTTVVHANSWIVGVTRQDNGASGSSVTPGVQRAGVPKNVTFVWDSKGTVPTGAQSTTIGAAGIAGNWATVVASIAPAASAIYWYPFPF